MANFNKVILMGNLTRDPELRVMPSGNSVCNFGLAVNRNFTDKDGNKREETTFVDIDAFGRQAEVISKYLAKGRAILLEGRLRFDRWETNTGEKRSKLSVVLEQFQFVGGRDSGDGRGGDDGSYGGAADSGMGAPPQQQQAQAAPPSRPVIDDDVDEDVPF
ncbi:MAG TPA: single-stranded DNA-binding protein [Opitutales bacterium]|nr:single-stranded DNA-binding protein [Opitutales bacterium]